MLQDPICIDKHELYVTSSIGISIYPADGDSPETLLRNADAAMYKAKNEGRNSFQFYTEDMTTRAYERVALEANLRRAVENKEFYLCYQPQVDGISGKLIGMEALIRWEHPELGTIPPFKFIPLAVETGLIIQIDRFVMRTAMRQLKQWYESGLNPGTLALNLTVKQLRQDDFISVLKEMLIETGCLSEWIELEITEGEIMENPEQAIKVLQEISEMGIKLAIDDFGTGYSSLAYLKRLPVDKLKIDRSFISNLPDDEDDIVIVQTIIALSNSLRLSVIAEGVETIEQKEFLIGNGCPHIQGYFYGKPMKAESMLEMLKKEG
jgi:EAL domain-containing protein (putative c-di-GMP-specific phosphodiesterase class I)